MEVKLQISQSDYTKFINSYYFKKNLTKRLLLLVVGSLWIGSFTINGQVFTWSIFFLNASITAILVSILFGLTPYLIAKINIRRLLKTSSSTIFQTISTDDEGITIATENGK